MSQVYSDPSRQRDPYSLPDVETFEVWCGMRNLPMGEDGEPMAYGWYWQACFPGHAPDGEPMGPFDTEADAIADAQDY